MIIPTLLCSDIKISNINSCLQTYIARTPSTDYINVHNLLNFHLFFHRQSQAEAEPFAEAFIHETDAKWSFMFNSYRNDTTLDVSPFFSSAYLILTL